MSDLRLQLERCFRGRVCVVGVGNVDWGDDGLGVRLAEALQADPRLAAGPARIVVAGTAPERYLAEIKAGGFDHVLFLDAVDVGAAPGAAVFLDAGEIAARLPQVSTHKISLGTLARWVEAGGTTRAWLLGVQPASLRPAADLSPDVRRTLDVLARLCAQAATGTAARRQPAIP